MSNDNQPAINIIYLKAEDKYQVWVDTEEGILLQGTILGLGKSLQDARVEAVRTLERLENSIYKANIYIEDEFGELNDDAPVKQGDVDQGPMLLPIRPPITTGEKDVNDN